MALLMVVPIRDRGDSVLIVANSSGNTFTGFVAGVSLESYFQQKPSMCECVSFVKSHLASIEKILSKKAKHEPRNDQLTPCIEITTDDLDNAFELERN